MNSYYHASGSYSVSLFAVWASSEGFLWEAEAGIGRRLGAVRVRDGFRRFMFIIELLHQFCFGSYFTHFLSLFILKSEYIY